jgi:hypothetical protein
MGKAAGDKPMRNQGMARKLADREAVDVSKCERDENGDYVMKSAPVFGMDYCDAADEAWIWSIGKRKTDGTILASRTTRFYQHPDFECLWAR